jgi:PTS system fructose-specific IIA component/PTS system nitrogen regulatory IIA component
MVQMLLEKRGFLPKEVDEIARSVMKREELGSTGIGRGVGIPHTKTTLVNSILHGWFYASPPVLFNSMDGNPVSVFVCIISPADRPGDHLRILEWVSRALREVRSEAKPPDSQQEWEEFVRNAVAAGT